MPTTQDLTPKTQDLYAKLPSFLYLFGCWSGAVTRLKRSVKRCLVDERYLILRTMQALVYTAPGGVELEQRPRPEPQKGEEEIAIEVAGVCGSDISGFLGHSALRRPPLVLGHELVGRRRDGRRVVANPLVSCGHCEACISGSQNLCESWKLLGLGTTPGTFAEYVALPFAQVYEVPDSLTAEQAILAEPLANVVHLFRIVSPPPFFRLAIIGAGTMGALAVSAALRIGGRDVLAADVNEQRLETMRKLGASATVNAATSDAVADCSPRSSLAPAHESSASTRQRPPLPPHAHTLPRSA